MKDCLGTTLKVGDIIVYGCGRGEVDIALIAGFKENPQYKGRIKTKIKVWRIQRRSLAIRDRSEFPDWESWGQPENFRHEVVISDRHHFLNGMGNYIVVCPDAIGYDDVIKEVQRVKELRLHSRSSMD